MNCRSCGYKVDRFGPDGAAGMFCSCACKAYWKLGWKYPIQKLSKTRVDSFTFNKPTEK